MKNFLLTIFLFVLSLVTKAQVNDFPKYYVVENDTVGIILTVEQVQKLDNDVELLELFKKLQLNCDNLTVHYVQIINNLEEKVALMEVTMNLSELKGKEKDDLVKNLKEQLKNCETNKQLCDTIIKNKDKEIKVLKREIVKQKLRKTFSLIGNVALIVVMSIIIIKYL